jgi:hypothetical protein
VALLVGIKEETLGGGGCELDVDNMAKIISVAGNYEFIILKGKQATASAILDNIDSAASHLKSGDTFIFYFSGHGGRKPDTNGDENDKWDETLLAYGKEIVDDELGERWVKFAAGVRIVMLSDSCYSGTNAWGVANGVGSTNLPVRWLRPISFAGKIAGMKAQMIHFGACRDDQECAAYMEGGAFTRALIDVWQRKSGKFPGYKQLYGAINKRLNMAREPQKPQMNLLGDVQDEFLNSKPFSLGKAIAGAR